jgi:hypothetical protein
MRLPDPATSMAVLIGCSRFEGMEPLPAVIHNISDLRDLLTDPLVWGLPRDRCVVMAEPRSPADIIDTINKAAEAATDTFLVYYAGHGLLDDRGRLHLGLGQTGDQKPHTALPYDYVRAAVQQHSKAELNMVVLDCCYSGGALKNMMGGSIGAVSAVEGAYVLTSSAENEPSMAPPEDKHTAFSGVLIRLLRDGLPGAGPYLGFDEAFHHLCRELAAKDLPQPQQAVRNSLSGYAFAPNRAHASPPPPRQSRPSPPPQSGPPQRADPGGRRPRRPLSPSTRRTAVAGTLALSLAAGAAVTVGLMNSMASDAATERTDATRPLVSPTVSEVPSPPATTGTSPAPAGTGGPPAAVVPAPLQPLTKQTGGTSRRETQSSEPGAKSPATTSPTTTAPAPLGSPMLVTPPDQIVYTVPDTVNFGWQAVAGASVYTLETEAGDGVSFQPVATHRVSGTTFSEAWPGWQKFRWRVTAEAPDGRRSGPSEWRHAFNNATM